MSRISILLIGNFLSKSKGAKSVSEEIASLFNLKKEWSVITASSHRNRLLRLLDIIQTILFQHHKYDVAYIEVYSGLAFVWAEVSARLLYWLNKPFILALHGGGLPVFNEHHTSRIQKLLSLATTVTTPSFYIQQSFRIFREDIIYLPNGLKLHKYPFKLRLNPKPNLCWLRAFHKIYNPNLAIEVVNSLRRSFVDIHLTMIGPNIGDGSLEQTLEMIESYGLAENISIIGSVSKDDVPCWLEKSDIFINTTHLESFGVGVMEAGALGLPIISTNVGELEYLWINGENAILVPDNDSAAMTEAILRVLNEPNLAEKLSRNARSNAERYDWLEILPQLEQLICKTVGANEHI